MQEQLLLTGADEGYLRPLPRRERPVGRSTRGDGDQGYAASLRERHAPLVVDADDPALRALR